MTNATFIQQAQRAVKTGQKQQARLLLQQAIRHNPQDYAAWLWLASITSSPRTALEYVRRAEMLNPTHPAVGKARIWAEQRLRAAQDEPKTMPVERQQTSGRPSSKRSWPTAVIGTTLSLILLGLIILTGLLAWDRLDFPQPVLSTQPMISSQAAVADTVARAVTDHQDAAAPGQAVASVATPSAEPGAPPPAGQPRVLPKNIAAGQAETNDPRPTWTITPTPTPTPLPTPTPVPTFVNPLVNQGGARPLGVGPTERWVDVNLTSQTLVAYEGDQPVLNTIISSGTWQHPTVTGQFRIYVRYESQTMDGRRLGYDYYLENVPYVMYFYQDYALHGTYWHNNFGTPMSHGCVNMKTPDAGWLFNWASIGTLVNVHY
jgi:lipoprotein-anchoring transpeptidase ErfK/SrfK